MKNGIKDFYEGSGVVFMPKGKNRGPITEALQDADIDVPEFAGRRLTARYDGRDWMLARDADMFTCLDGRPDGMGFMGTDTWGELAQERQPDFSFLKLADADMRLALLATEEGATPLRQKVEKAEPLLIATTYPQGARLAINGLTLSMPWQRSAVNILNINGSIEGAPAIFPQVDAVYDVVESGRTAEDNGLRIVYDNLAPVMLGAVAMRERP